MQNVSAKQDESIGYELVVDRGDFKPLEALASFIYVLKDIYSLKNTRGFTVWKPVKN